MKKLLLALCAGFVFSAAQAQYYTIPQVKAKTNPGNLNNDDEINIGVTGGPTGWNVLHNGPASTPAWTPITYLPGSFNFKFNNLPVTGYQVSTTGVLTFTSTALTVAAPPMANAALPSAAIPDKSICIWGLYSGTNDKIAYKMFGVSPNRQYWIQFNSYSIPGYAASSFAYMSIVLEESTNKIYLVDQRVGNAVVNLSMGVQLNSTTAFQVAGSPNVHSFTDGGKVNSSDNSYYEFIYGTQPARDLTIKKVNNPEQLALVKAPFRFTGELGNLGTATVTSFNLNYKVDNNAAVSVPVTGVNIPSNSTYQFTHTTPWTPTVKQLYNVKVWASNINGAPDQATANDTIEKEIRIVDAVRTVLHEGFTSSTCGPCYLGNQILHEVGDENPGKYINIKYQQPFPGAAATADPYYTQESYNRLGYYGVTGIPAISVNGGAYFNTQSYTSAKLATAYNVPAVVGVDGTYSINPVDSTVTANVVITPFANINSSNLVLHTIITEKHTKKNVRTNGETDFYDVMKKMLPNSNGLAIPALVNGQNLSYSHSFAMTFANYTVPYTKRSDFANRVEYLDSLRVVFFVQDKVTKEVFNAGMGTRVSSPLGVSKNIDGINLNVYPNPTNGNVFISFMPEKGEDATVEIYNTVGQKVFTKSVKAQGVNGSALEADLSGQANGIYILNLKTGDKTVTKKISLLK